MQAVQLIEAFAAGSPDRDGRHQGDFYRRIKPECGNGVKRDSKTVDSWSDRPMREAALMIKLTAGTQA
jgi:hypothetical protein